MSLHVEVSEGDIPTNFALLLDDERALPEGIYFQPWFDDSRRGYLLGILVSVIALIVALVMVLPMYLAFFRAHPVDSMGVAIWSGVAVVSMLVLRWSWRRHRFQKSLKGLVAAGLWREGLYLLEGHLFFYQRGVCTLIPHTIVEDIVKDQIRGEEEGDREFVDIDVLYAGGGKENSSFRIPSAPHEQWRDLLYWRAHGRGPVEE
jgi:hypothetical protein